MGTILYVATNQGVVTVKKSGTEWEIGSHGLKNWDVNEIAILVVHEWNPRNPGHQ
jgi:hypothetical protein